MQAFGLVGEPGEGDRNVCAQRAVLLVSVEDEQ